MSSVNSKIGNKLKELRTANGWTQQQVADLAHISRVNYTRYETDVCNPDFDTLLVLADLFDISLDELFDRKNFL